LPIIRNPPITGGLSVEEIAEQHAAIDRLNAGYGVSFRVFKGIESDILLDGALDYPDEVLQRLAASGVTERPRPSASFGQ
jgi:histidinol phosphatase-like PHP family hydrolase